MKTWLLQPRVRSSSQHPDQNNSFPCRISTVLLGSFLSGTYLPEMPLSSHLMTSSVFYFVNVLMDGKSVPPLAPDSGTGIIVLFLIICFFCQA